MERKNLKQQQRKSPQESFEAFRALVLLVLIAAFIGTQFYFLFSSIMEQ